MTLQFRKAERSQKPLKLALKGPSGCGKTYSALLLGQGLVADGLRIAVIDSEDGGADMYDAFDFDVVQIGSNATGADYMEAMEVALTGGYGLVIIDSLSHDWEQVINKEATLPPENMKSWAVAKSQTGHAEFLQYLWRFPLDVICTIRCDEAFEVARDEKGRITKKKVGLKPIQQPRLEYNFDIVFDIEGDTHVATSLEFGKNRTPLFQGERFLITKEHGRKLRDWKHGGSEWVEPIRDSTRSQISKYIVALQIKDTWRDLMKIPADRPLTNFSEDEGQELLKALKTKLSDKEKAKK